MNNDDFTVLVSGGGRCSGVSMCTVWLSHSKWLSEYSKESASNFVLSLNIPLQKLFGWFRRPQLCATGDWQLHHNSVLTNASHLMQSFLAKHEITQVTQPLYSLDSVPHDLWLFPKLKSPKKGKRFQTINEIQENRAADGDWENCVRSQGAYFEGDWGIIVLCRMLLVSSSINVSIFHITWLDTFWTDLIYVWKGL